MPTPLFPRIDTVFLPVRDVERATHWYRESFGLPLLWQGPGVACLKLGETPLTLLQHRHPGFTEAPDEFQPLNDVPFNFYAADLHAARDELAARGVAVSEINDYGSVQDFIITDPDGNRFGVCSWHE